MKRFLSYFLATCLCHSGCFFVDGSTLSLDNDQHEDPEETDDHEPCGDPEVCDDGLDNDEDGDIDCADSDCLGDEVPLSTLSQGGNCGSGVACNLADYDADGQADDSYCFDSLIGCKTFDLNFDGVIDVSTCDNGDPVCQVIPGNVPGFDGTAMTHCLDPKNGCSTNDYDSNGTIDGAGCIELTHDCTVGDFDSDGVVDDLHCNLLVPEAYYQEFYDMNADNEMDLSIGIGVDPGLIYAIEDFDSDGFEDDVYYYRTDNCEVMAYYVGGDVYEGFIREEFCFTEAEPCRVSNYDVDGIEDDTHCVDLTTGCQTFDFDTNGSIDRDTCAP